MQHLGQFQLRRWGHWIEQSKLLGEPNPVERGGYEINGDLIERKKDAIFENYIPEFYCPKVHIYFRQTVGSEDSDKASVLKFVNEFGFLGLASKRNSESKNKYDALVDRLAEKQFEEIKSIVNVSRHFNAMIIQANEIKSNISGHRTNEELIKIISLNKMRFDISFRLDLKNKMRVQVSPPTLVSWMQIMTIFEIFSTGICKICGNTFLMDEKARKANQKTCGGTCRKAANRAGIVLRTKKKKTIKKKKRSKK